MRIIQITDLHIGQEGEETFGVDVRTNFLNILAEAKFLNPDYLVVTGDLCYDKGDVAIYQWIKARLDKTELPYQVIGGNHDDVEMMREVFAMDHVVSKKGLYYAMKLGKQTCLFMDSSTGKHSKEQLKWLQRQVYNSEGDLVIFTHHPPVMAGVKFMDNKYALQDMDQIQPLLLEYKDRIQLFCGHYHVDKSIHFQNLTVHITPSCYIQIQQDTDDFLPDHYQIALRIIDCTHEMIQTTVRYFEGKKL